MQHPVYTLGSPDPRCYVGQDKTLKLTIWQRFVQWIARLRKPAITKSCTSPWSPYTVVTPCDIKFEIHPLDGPHIRLGEIQSISVNENQMDGCTSIHGELIYLLTGDDVMAKYRDLPFDIILNAANEYGHIAKMTISDVRFESSRECISIDDLLLEKHWYFTAKYFTPWTKVKTNN